MSDLASSLAGRAALLRDAFDGSFAEARPPDPPPTADLLGIRIATEPHALHLSGITGLFADRKVTPVPGCAPGLLGIAGFRGTILPVYDLDALLGHRATEAARWLAIAAGAPVAFAFGALDGHLRVALDAIIPQQAGSQSRRHIREFARIAEALRPIVDLASVIDAIRRQLPANLNREER
jgi:chemotaxis signal transduction protein